ncbi:DUF3617 domain-containing protein [Caulobacter sp. KR2-114]|uniref:DUF3617 domain-containing protein n=1 Tax=Caulobacter sp. KR2-114 TaxID=3400912 RepID=UPI003BFE79CD
MSMIRTVGLRSLGGGAAALLLLGAGLPPDAVRPGYWESTSTLDSPVASSKTERRCITAQDVAKFMLGPSNHIYSCSYPVQSARGGHIAFKGHCTSRQGREADIAGQGTYSPTTLHVEAQVQTTLASLPITATATTDAHRIADACPAPTAPPAP